ncbi:hypothetical protein J1605_021360 [Eschrichtius robustus]|uniref:AT-rich interactive domain-containing protein 3B n=1 Tax=Eschrichtius robustus TaxID=9764 RepID=A0AB34HE05_ESCRO|nr:hypothetical protein J1605_021360 [Eschrichtius robustus]
MSATIVDVQVVDSSWAGISSAADSNSAEKELGLSSVALRLRLGWATSLFGIEVSSSPTNGGLAWSDDADGGRGREISRDFAKLYELDSDPERKEFLDDLFVFMQKRGLEREGHGLAMEAQTAMHCSGQNTPELLHLSPASLPPPLLETRAWSVDQQQAKQR